MRNAVEIDLKLDNELKAAVRKAAKAWNVSVNEFIVDALQSYVRQETAHRDNKEFVRHGGKHKHGKSTGYEVTDDGKYFPAPLWVDRFDQLFSERSAISRLINELVTIGQERLIAVEKEIGKAKKDLINDLGLDPEKPWIYYGGVQNYLALEVQKDVSE